MVNAKFLQRSSLFGGILEEHLDKFIQLMVEERYSAGDIIIAEGTPNDRILFIVEGKVSVIKGGTVIFELAEGHTFGEMEVLDIMPCAANIQAVTNVTTLSISNMALREIYRQDIKSYALLMMNLARDLSRRLRAANDKLVNVKYTSSIVN